MMACPKNPFPPVSSRVRGDDGDDGGETAAPSEPGTISQSMPETSAKASWEHLVMLYLVEVKEEEQSRPEQGLFRVRQIVRCVDCAQSAIQLACRHGAWFEACYGSKVRA